MKKVFKGSAFSEVLSELVLFKPDTEKVYELNLTEKKKKRSLDANAYCWALLGQLSDKLRIPPEELYKEFIRRGSSYTVVPIKNVAVERYAEIWQSNGIGWIVENLGESKHEGYTNLKCYHGSSRYDSKEMSYLIDEIVEACKEQGIETASGAELQRLKEGWK